MVSTIRQHSFDIYICRNKCRVRLNRYFDCRKPWNMSKAKGIETNLNWYTFYPTSIQHILLFWKMSEPLPNFAKLFSQHLIIKIRSISVEWMSAKFENHFIGLSSSSMSSSSSPSSPSDLKVHSMKDYIEGWDQLAQGFTGYFAHGSCRPNVDASSFGKKEASSAKVHVDWGTWILYWLSVKCCCSQN